MTKVAKLNDGDLTEMQDALVEAMFSCDGNLSKAGEVAGYSSRSNAWRAWQAESVQAEFLRRSRLRLNKQVAHAISARGKLLNAKSEKVRLEAVQDVLNRAGISAEPSDAGSPAQINVQINLGTFD